MSFVDTIILETSETHFINTVGVISFTFYLSPYFKIQTCIILFFIMTH